MTTTVPAPPARPQQDPDRRRSRLRPGPLLRFVLRRLFQVAITLVFLVPLTFFLFRAVPGDPATAIVGPDVDPAVAEQLRERYGLDESLWQQFWSYVSALAHGDLGTSFQYKVPVTDLLADRLLYTMALVVPALILAVVAGVALGAIAASSRPRVDDTLRTGVFAIKAAPIFWVSTLALILFSFKLEWVPSIGMFGAGSDGGFGRFFTLDFLHHLILPMSILVLYYLVEPMLTMRTTMKDVLSQEFITHEKAQGLRRSRILYRHGARNAALPVVSLAPTLVDNVIGGQIIVETVFSWPGMGRAVVDAVHNYDYPMMQGIFLLTAVAVVLINAAIDVIYAYLDPRVRLS